MNPEMVVCVVLEFELRLKKGLDYNLSGIC